MIRITRLFHSEEYLRTGLILTAVIFILFKIASLAEGDFFQFYQASRMLLQRQNPYSFAAHLEMRGRGFSYPPAAMYFTLLPSLLPFGFALLAWDLMCLLFFSVSTYLWASLLLKRAPRFPEFVRIFLGALIAPALWAFPYHHLIIPVLFLATLAFWLTLHRRAPWAAGVCAGLMLIKPHLTLLLAITLFLRTPHKARFAGGLLLALILPFLPFISGYRPVQDLAEGWKSIHVLSHRLYVEDDQDLVANAYRLLGRHTSLKAIQDLNVSGRSNFLVSEQLVQPLNRWKMVLFAVACSAWIFVKLLLPSKGWEKVGMRAQSLRKTALTPTLSRSQRGRGSTLVFEAALALALGVLCSPYSHAYDGVLLVPWVILGMFQLAKRWHLATIATGMFLLNGSIFFGGLTSSYSAIQGNVMAWMSILYFVLMSAVNFRRIPKAKIMSRKTRFLPECNAAVIQS